jgi:hypothetical protein
VRRLSAQQSRQGECDLLKSRSSRHFVRRCGLGQRLRRGRWVDLSGSNVSEIIMSVSDLLDSGVGGGSGKNLEDQRSQVFHGSQRQSQLRGTERQSQLKWNSDD